MKKRKKDTYTWCQLILVLVLWFNNKILNVQEHFYKFIKLLSSSTDTIILIEKLPTIFPETKKEAVAQAYDGAFIIRSHRWGSGWDPGHQWRCLLQSPLCPLVKVYNATRNMSRICTFLAGIGGFSKSSRWGPFQVLQEHIGTSAVVLFTQGWSGEVV